MTGHERLARIRERLAGTVRMRYKQAADPHERARLRDLLGALKRSARVEHLHRPAGDHERPM